MVQGTMASNDEVLAEFRAEYDRIRSRLRENQQLIEQSQLEVDRLRERSVAVSSQLRRIEGNFDTVPRSDIKTAYDDSLDAKSRLLTMQGQLEKLKSTQEELEYFEQLVRRLLELVEGAAPDRLSAPGGYGSPSSSSALEGTLPSQLIIRVVEAQESERQRLARHMHDGPAQSLTNFILQAEICQRLFDRNPDRARDELDQLKSVASTTFQKVRDFIFDLRPMMLDDLGLVPTMRRYVEAYQEKTEIDTQINILGDERRLPSHLEVMMFRSIQEILGHARDSLTAKSVTIVLDMGPEWIKSTVDTDGHGFDPAQVLADTGDDNLFGLRTLKERIELVGGRLEVTSAEEGLNRFVILLPSG